MSGWETRQLVPVRRPALADLIVQHLNRDGVVVVTGGPGVGKTHLIQCEVLPKCSGQFLSTLSWSEELQTQPKEFSRKFIPRLHPPVLLHLDDVPGPESLPDVLLHHGFQLIVISPAPAERWKHMAKVVEVGPFSRGESVGFLTDNLKELSEQDAVRLAEHLGDLPLVLTKALRWFTPGVTVDGFLRRAKTHAHEMFEGGQPGGPYASLLGELRRLAGYVPQADRLSPVDVLGALALMDGAPFPVSLLDVQPLRLTWRSALNDLPPNLRIPLYGLGTVLEDLERRGIVHLVDGEARLVWLTCQLVRLALSSAELERAARLAEMMLLGTVPRSKGVAQWKYWPSWEASAGALQVIDPRFLRTSPGRYALLASCDFLLGQGRAAEARDRLLALRSAWRHTRNVPLDVRVRAYDLLTQASYQLGDDAARRYGATAFRVRRTGQDRRPLDAITIAGAAHWALAASRVDWLAELRQLAVDLPDQRLALRIASFAMLLSEQSSHDPCLADSIREIVRAQSDILGPEHPHTLFTMDLLARAYQSAGRAEEALEQFARTLELRARTLGPGHTDTRATADALYRQRRDLGREASDQFGT